MRALVPDALGEWLPLAMADLMIAMLSMWGPCHAKREDILASWGIEPETDEEEKQRNIEAAFDRLENWGKHGTGGN